MDDEPRIRDIPSFKKLQSDIQGLKAAKRTLPVLRPLLRLLRVDISSIDQAFADFDGLERTIQDTISLPDRFDDILGPTGWILYDLMSVEVAKAALQKAESGHYGEADNVLADYFSPDTVRLQLRAMTAVEAFRPRMPLAEKALLDYGEGRFYACILVVLTLLDGMVSELHEQRRGFFAEGANLEAWDSIAANSKGLNTLSAIFRKGRRKTTIEQITVPYRHGILHGMDLGYDNKIVAAKTWAALFATRDWALKAQANLLGPQPEQRPPGWRDLFLQIRNLNDEKARLKDWKARSIRVGQDIPTRGDENAYHPGTPERRLAQYFSYWQAKNYGFMAQHLSSLTRGNTSTAPARVRRVYGGKRFVSYDFLEVVDTGPAMSTVATRVTYEEDTVAVERSITFRLINEDASGSAVVRGKPESDWRVLTWDAVT